MAGLLHTTSKYFPSNEQLDLPAIVVQVTTGAGVYIVWAGTTNAGDISSGNNDTTGSDGGVNMDPIEQQGRLGADWACSMGSNNPSVPLSGTTLLRTTNEAVAFPMSQRLARRFKTQIFLSIDLSPSHITGGRSPTVAMAVEKAVLEVLKGLIDAK